MFALVQICGVLSSRGTCYPHVRCISIYTCRKYNYHIGHSNRIISVIIVIEMVKDGILKWTDCRPSLALSKWYCKNRAKYTCIRFARLTMLQIYAKAGQLLDPSFLCPYDQCSRYMQYQSLKTTFWSTQNHCWKRVIIIHKCNRYVQVNSCTSQSEVFFIIECFRGDIIKYCLTN